MKIAVGFVHGIGKQKETFHQHMAAAINERLLAVCPAIELVTEGIYWADITERMEEDLKTKIEPYDLRWDNWVDARGFVISFLGDAIAYQPLLKSSGESKVNEIYEAIHTRFLEKLRLLAKEAGPSAPLILITHSLGSIITSNFVYDLQQERGVSPEAEDPELVRGETLTHLYTMGSPIAIWTMRYDDFGIPIACPPPKLSTHGLAPGEWVNFYDKDDSSHIRFAR